MAHHPRLDQTPMACSEPPPVRREDAFRDMLLTVAQKMTEENASELAFAASCNLSGKLSALNVLEKLLREGVFSPYSCNNLEALLRRINRCDIADIVKSYCQLPDPPTTRRHVSVAEKGSNVSGVQFKRSSTDPPSVFHCHLSPANNGGTDTHSARVLQEQGNEGESEMSSGCVAVTEQSTTPPRGLVSMETSPDHELFGTLAIDKHSTPNGHNHPNASYHLPNTSYQPNSSYHQPNSSYQRSSAELLPMVSPTHAATYSFDHSTPAHPSCQPSGPISDPSYQGSQERYSQSKSATVSREGSFHSLHSVSQQSRASLKDKASEMAHLAIDLIAHISQEQQSDDWYMSNSSYSLSSVSSSARHTYSDTASIHSESGDGPPKPWNKKYSQSFHGSHTSCPPQRRKKRSPSVPLGRHDNTGHTTTHPTPSLPAQDEIDLHGKLPREDVNAEQDECDDLTLTKITLRQKKGRLKREQLETQCHSVISDATPRQSMIIDNATHPRHSVVSEATLTRSPVTSDTTVSGPGSPGCVRESHDVTEVMGEDWESLEPSSPYLKERNQSRLLRTLSFFRGKPHSSSPPSFMWKVGREELMKPVWRHLNQFYITRPGKFELDANLGKLNPKLTFQLFPNGLFDDKDEAVTMAVKITSHDKCPPLPPSSLIRLKLVVWGGEGKEVKRCPPIAEKLSMSVFYVYSVITHQQLKESNCKHFHLELEVSCSGLQRESLV